MRGRRSPFKGLESFDDSDHDALLFFGREREREIIVANLLASRLTVLYGDTGVGKSSVLRAGVARDLRAQPEPLAVVLFDEWKDDPASGLRARVAEATGAEPQARLTDALALGATMVGGEMFVILDGFEEEFLYHGLDAGPDSFFDQFSEAVTTPALRASFLLSVREDALAKLDRFKSRVPNLFGNYLRLPHLDRTAAREAIVGPIDRYNESAEDGRVEIEPALVEAVLDQVATGRLEVGQAGRGGVAESGTATSVEAPYLQLVMERLWEAEAAAGSNVLRLETLEQLGGAEQIVRDHLEQALGSLDDEQQDVAAAVFNYLVTPSGAKIAHDAADLAGYLGTASGQIEPVLALLAAERILRPVPGVDGSDLPRYEIYHDILAEAVLAWRTRHQSERQVEQVRASAARHHRRLAFVALAAAVLAGAMVGLAIFAFAQRSEADAESQKAHARSFETSSLSQLSVNSELGMALAVQATKGDRGSQAEDVLRRALLAARERGIFHTGDEVTVAQFSPDSKRVLVAGLDGLARMYDTATHRRLFKDNAGAPITSGTFSPDGKTFATGDHGGRIEIWSTRGGARLDTLRNGSVVRTVVFDRDGKRLVSAGGTSVKVWQLGSSAPLWQHRFDWQVTKAIFSPDSSLVAVIGNDSSAYLFDADTGAQRHVFDQGEWIETMAFSPHTVYFVTGGRNDTARVWNLRTEGSREFGAHKPRDIVDIAFAPNGLQVAMASTDGTVRTWDVETGAHIATLTGHAGGVRSVSFSRDARYVLTSSSDRTARIWKNTDTPDVLDVLAGHSDAVTSATFSPNGKYVLTASLDHTARLWDAVQPTLHSLARFPGKLAGAAFAGPLIAVAGPGPVVNLLRADGGRLATKQFRDTVATVETGPSGKLLAVATGRSVVLLRLPDLSRVGSITLPAVVTSIAFSPDGTRLVAGAKDYAAHVWTLSRPGLLLLKGHRGPVTGVAFSPDGKRIATSSTDGTARIWEARTGRQLVKLSLQHDTKPLTSVAFSPDGQFALTAGADQDARLWNATNGQPVGLLDWHSGTVRDAEFSPDGRWIVTIGPTVAQLWQPKILQPLFTFGIGGPAKTLTSAEFDSTSRVILTASEDGTIRTYRCTLCGDLNELLSTARSQLKAADERLTAADRRRYGGY